MLSPLDAMFLLLEDREQPAHVGGLALFEPPPDAGSDVLAQRYQDALRSPGDVRPLLARRPRRMFGAGPWTWQCDDRFDLEYHVRHSALPTPGRIRELLALVSRLHGALLDRHRPLWEAHLIEGLADGRFALYFKIHHAVIDGVGATQLLNSWLSTDPAERGMPFPWEQPTAGSGEPAVKAPGPVRLGALVDAAGDVPSLLVGAGAAAVRSVRSGFADEAAALPFQAPRSMLNVPVSGARRFAADSWELSRLRAVASGFGVTVNDIVLAMSAGALRRYLTEQDALPDDPLIAMVPVSLRPEVSDDEVGGNAVGALLCNLGTDLADPVDRLERIHASMRRGKSRFDGLTPTQILMLSALSLGPGALAIGLGRVQALGSVLRPGFNIVISNVPGARGDRYWNGARMTGAYPVSVLVDGQAMNITVASSADHLDVGVLGCRRNIPHLQRMLDHLEAELTALEHRVG